jgi:hypothetical protein
MNFLRRWWPVILFATILFDVFSTSYLLSTYSRDFEEGNPVAMQLIRDGKILAVGPAGYLLVVKLLTLLFFLGMLLVMQQRHYPEKLIQAYGLIATLSYIGFYAIGFALLLVL